MSNPNDYTVGWICGISTERVAAEAFLDDKHEGPESVSPNDNNDYTLGRIGRHNVVIAVLPHNDYGESSAASVARDMLHSFPNVRIGFMVGVGGGVPSSKHDIRLGDIVVSSVSNGMSSVFQYDLSELVPGRDFKTTRYLDQPPPLLRAAISGLNAHYEIEGHQIDDMINQVLDTKKRLRKNYKRPDKRKDRLFRSHVVHPCHEGASCDPDCIVDASNLISRPNRVKDEDNPAIHYGMIASGSQLIKNALTRDQFAAKRDVLCFETEAAGLMNNFPCLVIRGICDYCDSHWNTEWRGYAAMAAAAYTKDILSRIAPSRIESEKKISDLITGLRDDVVYIKSNLKKKYRGEMLNWLTKADFSPKQSDHLHRRQPETGTWFIESAKFQSWLMTGNQTLFCPGIPGAGKTILTSIVVNHLQSRFGDDPTIGIAYIYCNFNQTDEQDTYNLLASVLKQLAEGQSQLPSIIEDLHDQCRKRKTQPSTEDIIKTLQSVVTQYSRVFVMVDALDECSVKDDCRNVFVSQLFNLQKSSGINILVTSRPISEIENMFKKSKRIEITAHDDDLRRYLGGQISQIHALSSDDGAKILPEITKVVGGMFLLAKLLIETIKTKDSLKEIKQVLRKHKETSDSDPSGQKAYDNAYEEAMQRIKTQYTGSEGLANRVLSWIICAKRPLTTRELQHALAIELNHRKLDDENITRIERIILVCAGLVTIDEKSKTVRLIHFTAQEYFERTKKSWLLAAPKDIALSCITYLSFDAFETGICKTEESLQERLLSYPFYDYAAHNWGYHATEDELSQKVLRFLKASPKWEASGQVLMTKGREISPQNITRLHLAAYFGLNVAIDRLIRSGHGLKVKDVSGRTPLFYAVENGQEATVTLLLARGADVNASATKGLTALQIAAKQGHQTIVERLLKLGANPNAPIEFTGQTALQAAAEKGHHKIIKLLLAAGADVNAFHGITTALRVAAEHGRQGIVETLLKAGADVNPSHAEQRQTALQGAAAWGHQEIVVKLIKAGANVNAPAAGIYGRTALQAAAERGRQSIVKTLLEAGADVNAAAANFSGRTALQAAAKQGHQELVKKLLEAGADVNAPAARIRGRTALQGAAERGRQWVVKMLLEAGADVNAPAAKFSGRTALQAAAAWGYQEIVAKLLKVGADVNARATNLAGRTALQAAAEKGHREIVKKLLEAGADVDAPASRTRGRTAIQAAVEGGHREVEQLLRARVQQQPKSTLKKK